MTKENFKKQSIATTRLFLSIQNLPKLTIIKAQHSVILINMKKPFRALIKPSQSIQKMIKLTIIKE